MIGPDDTDGDLSNAHVVLRSQVLTRHDLISNSYSPCVINHSISSLQPGQLSLLFSVEREMSSIAYGLWGKGLVWMIGAVVCLLAALRVPAVVC